MQTETEMRQMYSTLNETSNTLKFASELKRLEDTKVQNQKVIMYIEAFKSLQEDKATNFDRWEKDMGLEHSLRMADTLKILKQIINE